MKFLGIDYGTKHVGLAVSDRGGQVAMPHVVIDNNSQLIATIVDIVQQQSIESVVVGASHNLQGGFNVVQQDIDKFSQQLQSHGIAVVMHNELFSSRQAKWGTQRMIRSNPRNADKRKNNKQSARIDDKAACIILQSYLDSQI